VGVKLGLSLYGNNKDSVSENMVQKTIREYIQKFPDWPPGARTENGTALCHKVQLYSYFVSQSSEFCPHNPLCIFSTSVYCCYLFRYRLSPETSGYTLVHPSTLVLHSMQQSLS
jgi:hypothetical protein